MTQRARGPNECEERRVERAGVYAERVAKVNQRQRGRANDGGES